MIFGNNFSIFWCILVSRPEYHCLSIIVFGNLVFIGQYISIWNFLYSYVTMLFLISLRANSIFVGVISLFLGAILIFLFAIYIFQDVIFMSFRTIFKFLFAISIFSGTICIFLDATFIFLGAIYVNAISTF